MLRSVYYLKLSKITYSSRKVEKKTTSKEKKLYYDIDSYRNFVFSTFVLSQFVFGLLSSFKFFRIYLLPHPLSFGVHIILKSSQNYV